jgi:major membrane immunogen (membrane-anchored lipoprotein)
MQNQRMKKKSALTVFLLASMIAITGCGSDSNSDSSSDYSASDLAELFADSANVSSVKNGTVGACPSATLGEMADAFMSSPSWEEFTSTTGNTVVQLSGEISYDGNPAEAVLQWSVSGSSFETEYFGINDVGQSIITVSALYSKMCSATY